jgi:hypothetical protein
VDASLNLKGLAAYAATTGSAFRIHRVLLLTGTTTAILAERAASNSSSAVPFISFMTANKSFNGVLHGFFMPRDLSFKSKDINIA